MSVKLVKRHAYFLSFTIGGFALLFVVGLLSSFFVSEQASSQINRLTDSGSLSWWRMAFYAGLISLWPRLVSRAIASSQSKTKVYHSRKPLLLIIFLYEFLIVLNPLKYVVGWVI